MNKTTAFLGIVATGLMVAGAIIPSAFALTQTSTITSNDTNTQKNTQTASLKAYQTNRITQINAPTSTTKQSGDSSVQVGLTNQNNDQRALGANFLSQSTTQNAANFHFSAKSINSTQSALCVIVGSC